MRQEFQRTLNEAALMSQPEEAEPVEGEDMEVCSGSPPRVIHSHHQHLADYMKSFMEKGEELTMGKDWSTL